MNLRERPIVAGRAPPFHPAEVHAAERFSSLRQVFTSHLRSQPLRRAGCKTDGAPLRTGSFGSMTAVGHGSIGDA